MHICQRHKLLRFIYLEVRLWICQIGGGGTTESDAFGQIDNAI